MTKTHKILIVEDDILVLKTLQRFLANEGFELFLARNGDEALNLLQKQKVDLIISDIRMPGRDGIRTFESWRFTEINEGHRPTPIILITGYASEEAPIDALKLGVVDYILKPFNSDELLASVRRSLTFEDENNFDIASLIHKLRNLIEQYQLKCTSQIVNDQSLKDFLQALDRLIFLLEKAKLKSESNQESSRNA